jgi:hypothetical protein
MDPVTARVPATGPPAVLHTRPACAGLHAPACTPGLHAPACKPGLRAPACKPGLRAPAGLFGRGPSHGAVTWRRCAAGLTFDRKMMRKLATMTREAPL